MNRLCVLGLLAVCLPVSALMDRELFVGLSASVLRIEAPRANGGYALGSAVAVTPDTVVTNCHVTREAREVFVVRGGVRWTAQAQAADVDRDLCLLRVPGLRAPPVPLAAASALSPGQSVTALGYTGGMGIQNSHGQIVALHRHDGSRVIQSNNWFSSGASGGGLFDDDGRLIGILTFRLRGGEAHYFTAPADWVRQMLDDPARRPFRAVTPLATPQLAFWQGPTAQQPRFLQAAVLLRDDRWRELAAVAVDWSHDDPRDAEPWFLLGTALERLGRLPESRQAFECSRSRGGEPAPQRVAAAPAQEPVPASAGALPGVVVRC